MKLILLGVGAALALSSGQPPSHNTQPAALDIGQNGSPGTPIARKRYMGTGERALIRHIKPSTWNQRKARKRVRQVVQLYKKNLKK